MDYLKYSDKRSGSQLTLLERIMIRDLILLPYMHTMVDKAIQDAGRSRNVLTQASLLAGEYIRKQILQDTYRIQKEFKERNIKIVEDENDDFLLYNMIYYRGYKERFGMTRDVMRTEISLRLTQYTADLGKITKSHYNG